MLYERFKGYISTLRPGDRLPSELVLAEQFNASRGMVREVISHLSLLGILERSTKRGTFVRVPTVQNISETLALQLQVGGFGFEELKEMRLLLECSHSASIVRRATPVALDRLQSLIEQMEEVADSPDLADELDMAFHLALMEICGNRILMVFSQVIALCFEEEYRQRFQSPKAVRKSIGDHQQMLDCVKRGDSEKLEQLVAEHITPT